MRPVNTVIVTKDSDGFIKTWIFNRLAKGWNIRDFSRFLLNPAYGERFEIISIQKAPIDDDVQTQFDYCPPICL